MPRMIVSFLLKKSVSSIKQLERGRVKAGPIHGLLKSNNCLYGGRGSRGSYHPFPLPTKILIINFQEGAY